MIKIQTLTTPTNVLTMMVIPVMIVQRVIMTHQMMAMIMMYIVNVMMVTVMMTMMAVKNVGITVLKPKIFFPNNKWLIQSLLYMIYS